VIVSGKVRVNTCSFVLVGSESVIVAWSRDWEGEYRLCELWEGGK
jgi:hypothetical protein